MTMQSMNRIDPSQQFVFDASALTDPSKQAQVYQYLETLKKDENGWKRSADNLVTNNAGTAEEQFLLLQVVEDFLKTRYVKAGTDDQTAVKALLSHWMNKLSSEQKHPSFLINKMAHIFSLVFAADFPSRWPRFMHDVFLDRGLSHLPTVIFYLKTLLAIDLEVVSREIERSKEMLERNTGIKDHMREICICECASTWCEILETIQDVDARCLVYDVVAAYVDWIDVELVANDRFVPLLVQGLSNSETSDSAIHTVEGLVQKGMPSPKKLTLVVALVEVMNNSKLLTLTPDEDGDVDEDDVQRIGNLISIMGHQLLDVQSKIASDGCSEADAVRCLSIAEQFVPTALHVLDNPDYYNSELVIEFFKEYVHRVRHREDADHLAVLARIVAICLCRYAMPNDLHPDNESETINEFMEYRRQLRSLLNPIGMRRPLLIIEPLEQMLEKMAVEAQTMKVQPVEAIVQLVYSLAEIIPANFTISKDPILARAARLPLRLVDAVPLSCQCAQVHVMFFENACRYDKLIGTSPDNAVRLICAAFLDERGIAFRLEKVRSRIVYLFVRFVKAHKAVLSPLVSEVVSRLAPLLAVSPDSQHCMIASDDQGFIFEATTTLIAFSNFDMQQKSQYISELATTLGEKFTAGLSELETARSRGDKNSAAMIAQFLSAIVGYASRMTKAFNTSTSMKSCMCEEIFLKLLNLFLSALTMSNLFLSEVTRQLSHRMVVCLETEIFPLLPSILSKLGECSQDLDSMQHLLILCHQIIAKHKKAVMVSGVDFGAILTNAARFSADPDSLSKWPQDEANKRALVYVQRAYCQILYTVVHSEMLNDLASNETAEVLLEAARRLSLGTDASSQKQALASIAKAGVQSITQNGGRWFEMAVRTALQVPALSHLSTTDAASQLVIHESGVSLLALRTAAQQPFDGLVTSLMPDQMGPDLLTILSSSKGKELDKNLNTLYARLRS